MFRSKHGFQVICGISLLIFAIPQLPFEYTSNIQALFTFLWVSMATLFVFANFRQLMKIGLFKRLQQERERRKLWLEAQRRMPSRRRSRVMG